MIILYFILKVLLYFFLFLTSMLIVCSISNFYMYKRIYRSTTNNTPFKVGDKVRCIEPFRRYVPDKFCILGEEVIITCISAYCIGFVFPKKKEMIHERRGGCDHRKIHQGKQAYWFYDHFELVESAEEMNQLRSLDESTQSSK